MRNKAVSLYWTHTGKDVELDIALKESIFELISELLDLAAERVRADSSDDELGDARLEDGAETPAEGVHILSNGQNNDSHILRSGPWVLRQQDELVHQVGVPIGQGSAELGRTINPGIKLKAGLVRRSEKEEHLDPNDREAHPEKGQYRAADKTDCERCCNGRLAVGECEAEIQAEQAKQCCRKWVRDRRAESAHQEGGVEGGGVKVGSDGSNIETS